MLRLPGADTARSFDQRLVLMLGDIDRDEDDRFRLY
jgi:hypothetical protein